MTQCVPQDPVCSRTGTDQITRPPVLSSLHTPMVVKCRAVAGDQTTVVPVQG